MTKINSQCQALQVWTNTDDWAMLNLISFLPHPNQYSAGYSVYRDPSELSFEIIIYNSAFDIRIS